MPHIEVEFLCSGPAEAGKLATKKRGNSSLPEEERTLGEFGQQQSLSYTSKRMD
jgi:hypothetical protein